MITVGMTYDLKEDYRKAGFTAEAAAEFDSLETIEAIEMALRAIGFSVERIGNVQALVQALGRGKRWDMVFNIAEGVKGFSREAQVPALLEAYDIPYTFSDPLVLSLALHKGMTKHLLRSLGIPTPDFYILHSPEEMANLSLSYPLFVKPVAEGTGKGITAASKVSHPEELEKVCLSLFKAFDEPLLVERYLSGREFTVGIAGTGKEARCLGVMEIFLTEKAERHAYSYKNKENYRENVTYRLVEDEMAGAAADLALRTYQALGCRDAGRVDLRADEGGKVYLLEINPLAGLNPRHSDLPIICALSGINFTELIAMIMDSALKRYKFKALL